MSTEDGVFIEGIATKELEGRGTGVVSGVALSSDVVVAEEAPVAWCIDPEFDSKVCDRCVREGLLEETVCPECGAGGVCEECRTPAHDLTECKAYRAIDMLRKKETLEDYWRPHDLTALCRLLFRLRRAVGPREGRDGSPPHEIWSLLSERASDDSKRAFRRMAAKIAAKVTRTDKADMHHLAGIVETNTYSLSLKPWHRVSERFEPRNPSALLKSVGAGVYFRLSYFNHSCGPNLVKVPQGLVMRLTTLRPMKAGEEMTHSYVRPHIPAGRRKDELETFWGFTCRCRRCVTPGELWTVNSLCSCSGYLIRHPDDPGAAVCHSCGEWREVDEDEEEDF